MDNSIRIDRKFIRTSIKRGAGINFFCHKYDCTIEEFETMLKKAYGLDTEHVLKEIEKNGKKHNRNKDKVESKEETTATTVNEEMKESAESKLEILKKEEAERSSEIMSLENERKALAQHHRNSLKKLREIDKELDGIRENFKAKTEEYISVIKEHNDFVSKMNEISGIRHDKVLELENIRSEIKKFEVVIIFMTTSGKIEIFEGANELEFDDSGHEDVYRNLLETEECENITVKNIKLLARSIKIVENSEAKISVLFEEGGLDNVFETLLATRACVA